MLKQTKYLQNDNNNNKTELELGTLTETRTRTIKVLRIFIESVNNIIKSINRINRLGYINSKDIILNGNICPPLLEIMNSYSNEKIDLKSLRNRDLKKVIKWAYNKLILDIYFGMLLKESSLEKVDSLEEKSDYRMLMKDLYNKLDPVIRVKIMNRGISVIKNIYTGFDTEYQLVSLTENKLLSVQLAVNTKIILTLPLVTDFTMGRMNPHTGVKYVVELDNSKYYFKDLESDINEKIKEVRDLKYYNKDFSIQLLIDQLKKRGVQYVVKDDCISFSFERTPIRTWFNKALEGYSLDELIETSNNIAYPDLEESEEKINNLLKDISRENNERKLELELEESKSDSIKPSEELLNKDWVTGLDIKEISTDEIESTTMPKTNKKYTRTNVKTFSSDKVNVTKKINNYIIGHLTNADLSMLNDFEDFKQELAIVNGSFVTLGKALFRKGVNVHIRDTMLLAPGQKKSLASIGELYGPDFNKISIERVWYEKMEEFMKVDLDRFKNYAIRDSLITLVHASYMENFSFMQGVIGIPLTLSSLASSYVRNKWKVDNYKGYQMSDVLIGEPNELSTPKSLNLNGFAAVVMNMFVTNYKGGRNESFMYGRDLETVWYDYDLTSAYTTAMSVLGNPNYKACIKMIPQELDRMNDKELIYSYIIIRVRFQFNYNKKVKVKYPSIPCLVDKGTTVYPLSGESYLTGIEYVLAKSQGCVLNVLDIVKIPFFEVEDFVSDGSESIDEVERLKSSVYKPFQNTIKELQASRRQYPKGTVNNLIYKDLGNSLYGLVSKGISNKKKYDVKTGDTKRVSSNDLSNPIMASWITAFVRSVIGELLHNIQILGGKVVSVTTDGFITNLPDLENKILNNRKCKTTLLSEYRKIREMLSGDPTALELKHEGEGVLSWTTRGQYSHQANIIATTGLQRRHYSKDELNELLNSTFDTESKLITNLERSLRSGTDLSKKGGSVTPILRDKTFRMLYDNRRIIEDKKSDNPTNLLDSKPMNDVEECELLRYISKLPINTEYHKNTSPTNLKYKNYLDVAVRTFIRGLFSNSYGLKSAQFNSYKDLINFVKEYKQDYNLTENIISQLKRRSVNRRKIVVTKEIVDFAEYVKNRIPEFDKESFLG